ncbi:MULTISPECIES: hypothetical protein [Alcaligenes]|nr:hypothetical protein [Alcaligenes ammonioxydans]
MSDSEKAGQRWGEWRAMAGEVGTVVTKPLCKASLARRVTQE